MNLSDFHRRRNKLSRPWTTNTFYVIILLMKVIARTTDEDYSHHFNPNIADKNQLQFREAAYELLINVQQSGAYGCIVDVNDYEGGRHFRRHYIPSSEHYNYELRGPIDVDVIYDKAAFHSETIPSITSYQISNISGSKYATYQRFSKYQPYTVYVANSAVFPTALKQFTQHFAGDDSQPNSQSNTSAQDVANTSRRIVFKPLSDFGGHGIHICPASELLQTPGLSFPAILQEFIESDGGIPGLVSGRHDLRVLILNGEVIGGSIRQPASGSLLSNTSQGGTMTMYERNQLPQDVIKFALDIDSQLPQAPRLYAADFFYSTERSRWYLVELNASPGALPSSFGPVGVAMQQGLLAALLEM